MWPRYCRAMPKIPDLFVKIPQYPVSFGWLSWTYRRLARLPLSPDGFFPLPLRAVCQERRYGSGTRQSDDQSLVRSDACLAFSLRRRSVSTVYFVRRGFGGSQPRGPCQIVRQRRFDVQGFVAGDRRSGVGLPGLGVIAARGDGLRLHAA